VSTNIGVWAPLRDAVLAEDNNLHDWPFDANERRVRVLQEVQVDLLVDVRSFPRSRTIPQLNADRVHLRGYDVLCS
jgi:hypothetical protein